MSSRLFLNLVSIKVHTILHATRIDIKYAAIATNVDVYFTLQYGTMN